MDNFILISIGLAILCYATGTIELLRLRRLPRVGVRVKGKRIGFTTIRDHNNDKIEVPVFEYVDKTGRTIKNKLDDNLHSDKSEIDIIYAPKNPRKIIPNDWTKNIPWIFLMTFGTIALIFMAIGLASR